MLPPELAREIRKLEIRTDRVVDELIGGAYHSVFKGRGIEFEEVREYAEGTGSSSCPHLTHKSFSLDNP